MIIAQKKDKPLVVNLLVRSFCDSKSIHYFVEREAEKRIRVQALMSYAFDYCMSSGEIFLSEDRQACALVLYPEKRIMSFESIWRQINFIVKASGWHYFKKVSARQKVVRSIHPRELKFHLWFMAVNPEVQRRGIGSRLLKQLIASSKEQHRIFCLETPDSRHIGWLHKHGFGIYRQVDLGHLLYCMFHKDVLWKAYPLVEPVPPMSHARRKLDSVD